MKNPLILCVILLLANVLVVGCSEDVDGSLPGDQNNDVNNDDSNNSPNNDPVNNDGNNDPNNDVNNDINNDVNNDPVNNSPNNDANNDPPQGLDAEVLEAARSVDMLCQQECALDVECNGDQAFAPEEECVSSFCLHEVAFGDIEADPGLLVCIESLGALYTCINALTCEDYNAYYDEEISDGFPCQEPFEASGDACAPYEDALGG